MGEKTSCRRGHGNVKFGSLSGGSHGSVLGDFGTVPSANHVKDDRDPLIKTTEVIPKRKGTSLNTTHAASRVDLSPTSLVPPLRSRLSSYSRRVVTVRSLPSSLVLRPVPTQRLESRKY